MFWIFLYKTGYFLATTLPPKIGYRLAEFAADVKYAFSKRDRAAISNNLAAILNGDSKNTKRNTRAVFRNFGKYLFEFFRASKVDRDYINKNVRLEGLKNLQYALSKRKGALLLSIHMGNWEWGAIVLSQLGYAVNAVALDHKTKWINDFFIKQRADKGIKVLSPRFALKKCLLALKNNELVAILGDREFFNQGIEIGFLGKTAYIPKGPALISLKTNAPIVPCFMLRQPDDSFRFAFEPLIEYTPCGDKEKDVRQLTKQYITVLEKYIRTYPTQWFIFHEFWKKSPNHEII